MATNSALNLQVTINTAGFSLAGGTSNKLALGIEGDGDALFLSQQNIEITLPDRASDTMLGWQDYNNKGVILVGTGSGTWDQLDVGEDGQTLIADSGDSKGVIWGPLGGAGTITGNDSTPIIQVDANWDIIGVGESLTLKYDDGTLGIWCPRPYNAIVDNVQYDGSYQTLAAAVAATGAGDVIFIRKGMYFIGVVTIPSSRILVGAASAQGTVQLNGTLQDGGNNITLHCQNLTLASNDPSNVDYVVKFTGTTSGLITNNCFIHAWLHSAVSLPNAGNSWYSYDCQANIQYINGVLYDGAGAALHYGMNCTNGAGTNTPTGTSGGNVWRECNMSIPVGASVGGFCAVRNSLIDLTGLSTQTYCVTCSGNSSGYEVTNSTLKSGNQPAINIGSGTACSVSNTGIYSTNSFAITGAGTLNLGPVTMLGSAKAVNVTTQVSMPTVTAKFPANSGTVVSNACDGYEMGTFTPTISGSNSAGTVNYVDRVGQYFRIGKWCFLMFQMSVTNATGSGDIRIGGLPFQADTGVFYGGCLASGQWPWPSGASFVSIQVASGGQYITVNSSGSTFPNQKMQMFNSAVTETFAASIGYQCV